MGWVFVFPLDCKVHEGKSPLWFSAVYPGLAQGVVYSSHSINACGMNDWMDEWMDGGDRNMSDTLFALAETRARD